MRVIVKHRHKKSGNSQDAINVYIPEKSTKYVETLKELWERECNAWDPKLIKEMSWCEEDHARIENALYVTEFFITNVAEVEV